MFLSRLNEINGGCEKILPVSGSFVTDAGMTYNKRTKKQETTPL